MKVAITDYTFPTLELEEAVLRPSGANIVARRAKTAEELIELVSDADVVITQFAPIKANIVAAMQRARAIVRYGIGVDNVDLDAARERGIAVCNVPDYCIDEVADHTLAFILAMTRQVLPNCLHVRGGQWGLAVPVASMQALRNLTVGVVGYGRIGREVATRLRSFKCKVLVSDPVVSPSVIEAAGCQPAELGALLSQADVVTLHCPSTKDTRGMIDARTLASMKPGVLLVNVARGDLVDLEALTGALASKHVGGAALDVFSPEPLPPGHPLLSMPNVIVASHIASVSPPAVKKLRETAARLALRALRGEPLENVVNGVTQPRFKT